MNIFTEKPPFDRNKRFVAISTVYCDKSIGSYLMCDYLSFEELKKMDSAFSDSTSIGSFYLDSNTVDKAILILLYESENSKEMRRRIAFGKAPESLEELKEVMLMVADGLGVLLNFHEAKIGSGFSKVLSTSNNSPVAEVKRVRENLFLHNLIDFYDGELTTPYDQLDAIKEKILCSSTLGSENHLSWLGTFLQNYILTRKNYYKIAEKFGNHLAKADLKIATKYIPSVTSAYLLEFPFPFQFSNFYLRSVLVTIVPLQDSSAKGMSIVCPKYEYGFWTGSFYHTTLDISDNESIEESLKETSKFFQKGEHLEEDLAAYNDFISYVLKCLIYIHSSESDLTPEKGVENKKKNAAKARKFFRHNNPFDMTNVGYSFQGRHYSDKEFMVSGHNRWQPCGPGMSQVKLIWIDEYAKNKKD